MPEGSLQCAWIWAVSPSRKITSAEDGSKIVWDRRGKHSGHEKVDDTIRDRIQEHLRSFSARSSHYSLSDNSDRVYLSSDLSIARLYRDLYDPEYVKLQEDNRERAISHQPVQQIYKPIVTLHFWSPSP